LIPPILELLNDPGRLKHHVEKVRMSG